MWNIYHLPLNLMWKRNPHYATKHIDLADKVSILSSLIIITSLISAHQYYSTTTVTVTIMN